MVHTNEHTNSGQAPPEDAWCSLTPHIATLEREGKVSRTFVRLDERRQRLVFDAILTEAAEAGPASVNVKRIAARADIAVGSLYQYFADRDALLEFAVQLCVRYVVDVLAQAKAYLAAMPLRDALRAYLASGLEWGTTERDMFRFLGRAAYQGDPTLAETAVRPIATAMREVTHEILVAAGARGELRPDLDVEAVARLVNAMTLSLIDAQLLPYLNAYFQLTDDSMPADRLLEALVDSVVRAVTPPEER